MDCIVAVSYTHLDVYKRQDLRNPIAIIQGYAQYLQLSLSGDKISREKTVSYTHLDVYKRQDRY